MPDQSDRHVRFYFGVSISCLIPPNPHGKRDDVPDDVWEDRYLEPLRGDLEARLSKDGFQVIYRKHVPIDGALGLYAADFVVSALHAFPATQVYIPKQGQGRSAEFSVRKKSFSKAKTTLERKIADSLKRDYVVNVTCEYAASRLFVFEVHLAGDIELEYVMSSSKIKDAGGSVRDAIEYFNDEVVDALKTHGCDAYPKTTRSRPKDHIYKFDVVMAPKWDFPEDQVYGDLALIEKDMPQSEFEILGIDCAMDFISDLISSEQTSLQAWCNCSPGVIDANRLKRLNPPLPI